MHHNEKCKPALIVRVQKVDKFAVYHLGLFEHPLIGTYIGDKNEPFLPPLWDGWFFIF